MEYTVNFKEKMEALVAEAKKENTFMMLLLVKYNDSLDETLKLFEELGDDPITQAMMYGMVESDLKTMIEEMKKIRKEYKL